MKRTCIVRTLLWMALIVGAAAGQSPPRVVESPVAAEPKGPPAFVVIYHPTPRAMDSAATLAKKLTVYESQAVYTVEEATKFLEDQKIDEASFVGLLRLDYSTKVDLKTTEVVVPVPPKTRRWQKKP